MRGGSKAVLTRAAVFLLAFTADTGAGADNAAKLLIYQERTSGSDIAVQEGFARSTGGPRRGEAGSVIP